MNGFICITESCLICGVHTGSHLLLEYWFTEKKPPLCGTQVSERKIMGGGKEGGAGAKREKHQVLL